jgi:hypothetical protein
MFPTAGPNDTHPQLGAAAGPAGQIRIPGGAGTGAVLFSASAGHGGMGGASGLAFGAGGTAGAYDIQAGDGRGFGGGGGGGASSNTNPTFSGDGGDGAKGLVTIDLYF